MRAAGSLICAPGGYATRARALEAYIFKFSRARGSAAVARPRGGPRIFRFRVVAPVSISLSLSLALSYSCCVYALALDPCWLDAAFG